MGITSWALGDKNYNTLQDLEAEYSEKYPGMDTSGGVFSDARHAAASSLMSDRLGGGTTGDVLSNIGGFAREVPTFTSEVMGLTPWGQSWEDVQANAQAFSYPSNTAAADIYADVFSKYNANKGIPATNTGYQYGAAQAEDLTNLERDFPGMSTGDIIDSMNARQRANRFSGMGEVGPDKSNMNAPAALDMDRFAGVSELGRNDADVEQVEYLGSPSKFQNFKDSLNRGLGSLKDFAVGTGKKGWDLGKMAMSGIGNAIMPGLGFLMSNLKPEPLYRETLANSRKANPLSRMGLEGVSDFGGFTTDDLGRITQTGDYITPENIMKDYNAGFDLAGSALGRIGKIQDLMARDPKSKWHQQRMKKIDALKTAAVASAQAKRQAYQDKIDRAKDAAAAQKARAKSITAGYGGHDHSPGATGPTAAGAGMGVGGGYASDYGFLKDGGRVGYANGGLASLFTRRG